ncbi:DMT family transporter [Gracilimonas sp. Q87]|uniref:DMT family transporter n=1 Tax=Gracilimonas sp. Q87 TaxID=3384766 RepID=UPI0039845455
MINKHTLALAVGFVLLWNSGFIGAEYGLPYTGPFTLVFWRYLALTLFLAGYLLLKKRLRWVGWKVAGSNMLIGILAHGVWLTCVLFALDNEVPAGIVALVVALQPLATGALSGYVTGERTNIYQWLGLVLGFTGVLVTVSFRIDFSSYRSVFGYLIPLVSVAAITIASLIQRRIEIKPETNKLPIDLTLFYQSLATTAVLALPAIYVEHLYTEWDPVFIYTMLWLILAVSLGAYALMWLLIERIEAIQVASLFYLGPPVTMLMAWIAFGDTIRVMDVAGLVIVFFGVFLTQFKTQKIASANNVNS